MRRRVDTEWGTTLKVTDTQAEGEVVGTAVDRLGPVTEDVAVADRIKNRDTTSVISPSAALSTASCFTVRAGYITVVWEIPDRVVVVGDVIVTLTVFWRVIRYVAVVMVIFLTADSCTFRYQSDSC